MWFVIRFKPKYESEFWLACSLLFAIVSMASLPLSSHRTAVVLRMLSYQLVVRYYVYLNSLHSDRILVIFEDRTIVSLDSTRQQCCGPTTCALSVLCAHHSRTYQLIFSAYPEWSMLPFNSLATVTGAPVCAQTAELSPRLSRVSNISHDSILSCKRRGLADSPSW